MKWSPIASGKAVRLGTCVQPLDKESRKGSFFIPICPRCCRIDGEPVQAATYIRNPFVRELDFGMTSGNYKLAELFAEE